MMSIVPLPLSPAQYAVVRGIATPEQRTIAKKQQRFIVLTMPYYPSVKDIREAMWWLTQRGFGKAPKIVPIEGQQTTGFRMEYRPWAPGTRSLRATASSTGKRKRRLMSPLRTSALSAALGRDSIRGIPTEDPRPIVIEGSLTVNADR